jgi:hypothetical protein
MARFSGSWASSGCRFAIASANFLSANSALAELSLPTCCVAASYIAFMSGGSGFARAA